MQLHSIHHRPDPQNVGMGVFILRTSNGLYKWRNGLEKIGDPDALSGMEVLQEYESHLESMRSSGLDIKYLGLAIDGDSIIELSDGSTLWRYINTDHSSKEDAILEYFRLLRPVEISEGLRADFDTFESLPFG